MTGCLYCEIGYTTKGEARIFLCPLHKAAGQMRDALEDLINARTGPEIDAAWQATREALAASRGES